MSSVFQSTTNREIHTNGKADAIIIKSFEAEELCGFEDYGWILTGRYIATSSKQDTQYKLQTIRHINSNMKHK